jgi:uncharacterized membrane protein YfcA
MHIQYRNNHQSNMEILKSLYERTHNYYIAVFSAILVLAGGILGSFIALWAQQQITSDFITAIIAIAIVILLVSLFILINKINNLHRNYLDILQIYNLLSRYF